MPTPTDPYEIEIAAPSRTVVSKFDERDYVYEDCFEIYGGDLPRKFGEMPVAILNQRQTPKCTMFGTFGSFQTKLPGGNVKKSRFRKIFNSDTAQALGDIQFRIASEGWFKNLFRRAYWRVKGMSARMVLWAFNHGLKVPGGGTCWIEAYYRVDTRDPKKLTRILFKEESLTAVILCREKTYDSDGRYNPSGRIVGAHLIELFGYDLDRQVVPFRNSYGENWGNNGIGEIPFAMLSKVVEIWCPIGPKYSDPKTPVPLKKAKLHITR